MKPMRRSAYVKTESILLEHAQEFLLPYFEHKQYALLPGTAQYRRKTSFGHAGVIVSAMASDEYVQLRLHLGVRQDLLEKALIGTFGQSSYYSNDSYSLLIDARLIDPLLSALPQDFRIDERLNERVEERCEAFIRFMDDKGFAFLDKYRKLSAIDRLYNEKPRLSARWCNHHYQRCFRGMTAAFIRHRSDVSALYAMHRDYLIQRGYEGQVLQKFERNFALQEKLSFN